MKTADLVDDTVYAVKLSSSPDPAALISHETWHLAHDNRVYRDGNGMHRRRGPLVVAFHSFHLRDLTQGQHQAARTELIARLPVVAENLRDQLPSERGAAQLIIPHPYYVRVVRPQAILAPWEEQQRVEAEDRKRWAREHAARVEAQRIHDEAERGARDRLRSVQPLQIMPTSYVELEQFGKDYAAWLAGEDRP